MKPKPSTEWSPNQVVAYNLRRARNERTQQEAAELLEPFLGELWSKATFSTAENSTKGRRIRQFTTDDLVAFSEAFKRPISFFLEAPPGVVVRVGREVVDISQWLADSSGLELDEVERLVTESIERLQGLKEKASPGSQLTAAEQMSHFLTSIPHKYAGEPGERRRQKDEREVTGRVQADARGTIKALLRVEHAMQRKEWQQLLAFALFFYQSSISSDPDEALAYVDELRQELAQEEEEGTA